MEFSNHTPFPALAFESFAPDGASFHTVVLRQTFELRDGALVLAQEQMPLATSDRFHGEPNQSSVAEESDLAPYKPLCDVLINGTAYAPQGDRCRASWREFELCRHPCDPTTTRVCRRRKSCWIVGCS